MTEELNGYKIEVKPTEQKTFKSYACEIQIEPAAQWDVIGTGSFVVHLERQRIPNRWVRFWTKVFFTSKWQLPEDN